MEPQHKIVDRAEFQPAKCAVTGDIDGPFIDTEREFPETNPALRTRIYLHTEYIKEVARELGMVDGDEVAGLKKALDDYGRQVENLSRFVEAHRALEGLVAA